METAKASLTVLFDDPFWIGLFERESEGRYEVCRVVFGAEPRDFTVYELIQNQYARLRFSPALAAEAAFCGKVNPKRAQREARRLTRPAGVGTKAQQALQLQRSRQKPSGGICPATPAKRKRSGGTGCGRRSGRKNIGGTDSFQRKSGSKAALFYALFAFFLRFCYSRGNG